MSPVWAFRPSDWGNLARDQRVRLGWSQADLAARAGTTRQWVNRFESGAGTASARLDLALRVMDLLGLIVEVRPEPPPGGAR
ncbi:MAG: helix-turn-helix domain-containing protein [Bifidobacteriaceae bacterium]|nr:helix-turn-helix domain-containing protein [Bifidobacteriaceae bacterium]